MNRLIGILLMVGLLYAALLGFDETARTLNTQVFIAKRLGFYGIITLGVGILIISGGIDLSIGSLVGLGAILFGVMVNKQVPPAVAALVVIGGSALVGLLHGVLVTRLRLQPFLVTLCGLFVYRGLARLAGQTSVGVSRDQVPFLRTWMVGDPLGIPQQLVLLIFVAIVLGLFLHGTRHGRYLYAIGANEQAAKYAGIPTTRYKILAYVICSTLAGLASVLEILDSESAQATNVGQLLELYAITGAVLGGCSLSGGEGTIPGMFLGAAVLPLLRLLCYVIGDAVSKLLARFAPSYGGSGISNELEYVVIGVALLLGTIADEVIKRRSVRRTG
jgi:ribose transport system permease protein